jgi:hydrogenase maturation protein HypF
MWVLDPVPLLTAIGEAERHGTSAAELAAALHDAIARSTVEIAARIARDEGIDTVTLGGGVFQNARLLVSVRDRLVANGLHVLEASLLPPNDGGLCFGQAAVAIARL